MAGRTWPGKLSRRQGKPASLRTPHASGAGSVYALLTLSLAGCAPSLQEGPPRLFPVAQETEAIKAQIGLPDLQSYFGMTPNDRTAYRNRYVAAEMYAIDLSYSEFERSLTKERQDVGLLSTTAILGLTSAATLATGTATKDILTTAATGVTGLQAGYSEEVLFKQTVPALQAQMRADRASVAVSILKKLRLDDDHYPLSIALSDVESYYNAGTLTGALVGVNASASAAAVNFEQQRNDVITYSISDDSDAKYLRSVLTEGGVYNFRVAQRLKTLLTGYGIRVPLPDVVSLPQFSAVRSRLVHDLLIQQTSPASERPPSSPPSTAPVHISLDQSSTILESYLIQHGHLIPEHVSRVRAAGYALGFPSNGALEGLIALPKNASLRQQIVGRLKLKPVE